MISFQRRYQENTKLLTVCNVDCGPSDCDSTGIYAYPVFM